MSRHGEQQWRDDAKDAAIASRQLLETRLGLRNYKLLKAARKQSLWARLLQLFK